jgi:hypothetical protein
MATRQAPAEATIGPETWHEGGAAPVPVPVPAVLMEPTPAPDTAAMLEVRVGPRGADPPRRAAAAASEAGGATGRGAPDHA